MIDKKYQTITTNYMGGFNMIDFSTVLDANPLGIFATVDEDKIRTRVFQALFTDDHKVYFCTNSQKSVYAQLQKNAYATFCTHPQDFSPVLSIHGKAVFVEDRALIARAFDKDSDIKRLYGSEDNPVFKLFYLDVEEVETFIPQEGRQSYAV